MRDDNERDFQRLDQWLEGLERFRLPDWESLPQLDLYMDQVILLLTRYLAPVERDQEERSITSSIINNYVRMKVMPPPVKKKYSRVHIAYLVMICTPKQSLSISCIRQLLPEDQSEASVRLVYEDFVEQYRSAADLIRNMVGSGGCLPVRGGGLTMIFAILSTLSKSLTEFLLQGDGADGDYDGEE